MPGIVAPDHYPIRRPTDAEQVNGRMVNPVRYPELGGLSGPGKWGKGNTMRVEKPTSVKVSHSSTGKNRE
jgi:hypothetical protein